MSYIGRFFDWVLGNGNEDHAQCEQKIQAQKAQVQRCQRDTRENFRKIGKAFEEIEVEGLPEETPLDFEGDEHGRS